MSDITVLVDSDIVAYRCSAACENDTEDIARYQTDEMMRRILHETDSTSYQAYLTGSNNFRYDIYPDYKANRKDLPKPRHLQAVQTHLVIEWKAQVTDGIEADDALGIYQCANENTIIASIDKDLLMIPGRHYNFVKNEFRLISPDEGLRNFYFQLIMGDRSDNIPGFDGKMRNTVPKFLQGAVDYLYGCYDEPDMYEHVLAMYDYNKEQMHLNAQCLWIQRKEGDKWQPPKDANLNTNLD